MKVVTTVAELREAREHLAGPVGLVPTMGYLHAGHLALVRAAREACASVIVSIFVNPKQFAPHEDFTDYPRDLDRDLRLLEEAQTDLVFVPSTEEIYPQGFSTSVDVGALGERLEGTSRPGHFRGVATVVTRLFCLTQPDRSYFGQKDAQQTVVIRRLVSDLGFPIEVVVVPTVRESDGLALSSRNIYLNRDERNASRALSASLRSVRATWEAGERDARRLKRVVRDVVGGEPLIHLEYVSVANVETLEELDHVDSRALVSLAAVVGKARLIDNITLG